MSQYEPRNSNYHDHLCDCPGCNYDGPEPSEEEGQRIMAEMGPEPFTPDATLEDIISRLESRQVYITAQVLYDYIVTCDIQGYSLSYLEAYCEDR